MNILSLENVSKNYGIRPLFENVTLGFEDTDKIGIIGANGSGKSTFLKVVAGTETPDTGKVTRTSGKTLAFLSQNPQFDDEKTVLETIFAASDGVMKTIRDYENACHDLAVEYSDEQLEKVSRLQHELEISGGWEIETNARNVLTQTRHHRHFSANENAFRRAKKTGCTRARTDFQTRHFDSRRTDQSSRRGHHRVA